MKSVIYDVEVYPDELAEHISNSVLINELSNRINKNEKLLEQIEDELDTTINNLTTKDYKILREIFINHELDKTYANLYETILNKV